jgi:hypothetical protein
LDGRVVDGARLEGVRLRLPGTLDVDIRVHAARHDGPALERQVLRADDGSDAVQEVIVDGEEHDASKRTKSAVICANRISAPYTPQEVRSF